MAFLDAIRRGIPLFGLDTAGAPSVAHAALPPASAGPPARRPVAGPPARPPARGGAR
jgi:hypothetical protein